MATLFLAARSVGAPFALLVEQHHQRPRLTAGEQGLAQSLKRPSLFRMLIDHRPEDVLGFAGEIPLGGKVQQHEEALFLAIGGSSRQCSHSPVAAEFRSWPRRARTKKAWRRKSSSAHFCFSSEAWSPGQSRMAVRHSAPSSMAAWQVIVSLGRVCSQASVSAGGFAPVAMWPIRKFYRDFWRLRAEGP